MASSPRRIHESPEKAWRTVGNPTAWEKLARCNPAPKQMCAMRERGSRAKGTCHVYRLRKFFVCHAGLERGLAMQLEAVNALSGESDRQSYQFLILFRDLAVGERGSVV